MPQSLEGSVVIFGGRLMGIATRSFCKSGGSLSQGWSVVVESVALEPFQFGEGTLVLEEKTTPLMTDEAARVQELL